MFGEIVGIIKIKSKLTKTQCLTCQPEDVINKELRVLEQAKDGDFLAVVRKDGKDIGLIDVSKDDVENFRKIETASHLIEQLFKYGRNNQNR